MNIWEACGRAGLSLLWCEGHIEVAMHGEQASLDMECSGAYLDVPSCRLCTYIPTGSVLASLVHLCCSS